jgi:hypothetical protein
MRADAERQRLHPGRIVTYGDETSDSTLRLSFDPQAEQAALDQLDTLEEHGVDAVVPVCVPGATAAEYLKFLAVCRLSLKIPHIQLDADWSGLKVAQLALRFGADDFGNRKPGSATSEEEIRRVIRDAGFIPKKRDPFYRSLAIL